MESQQKKLDRVRKPRVHIKYEVETEGAMVVKELPFVVGVTGDFSGDPTAKLPELRDRKFVQIDRDNFNDYMKKTAPRVSLNVARSSSPVLQEVLMRDGDNTIVFGYAGNLYTVPASGGIARRLTSHEGYEMFPRFSPDGTRRPHWLQRPLRPSKDAYKL